METFDWEELQHGMVVVHGEKKGETKDNKDYLDIIPSVNIQRQNYIV